MTTVGPICLSSPLFCSLTASLPPFPNCLQANHDGVMERIPTIDGGGNLWALCGQQRQCRLMSAADRGQGVGGDRRRQKSAVAAVGGYGDGQWGRSVRWGQWWRRRPMGAKAEVIVSADAGNGDSDRGQGCWLGQRMQRRHWQRRGKWWRHFLTGAMASDQGKAVAVADGGEGGA
jgi:hypothetical protein